MRRVSNDYLLELSFSISRMAAASNKNIVIANRTDAEKLCVDITIFCCDDIKTITLYYFYDNEKNDILFDLARRYILDDLFYEDLVKLIKQYQ